MSSPIVATITTNERDSCRFSGTLRDETGQPVALASLTDITLTLYNGDPDSIINSRSAISVKNANGGTVHATSGLFTMDFGTADSPIAGTVEEGQYEEHYALFIATWGTNKRYSFIVRIRVRQLRHVT